jgi:lipopolysaccharide transport system ATP-binding protein
LTGSENIYLNGSILGMSRQEISRKFDEIVAFSEVEQFLDTPVKRYSSGMYVRLAFAIAAHLEPEVLLVDEILAVGDIAFQRKCLERMREVSNSGRTILFVSHNMGAIEALCERAFLIERGRLVAGGPVHDVVRQYHQSIQKSRQSNGSWMLDSGNKERAGRVFRRATLLDEEGNPTNYLPLGGTFRMRLEMEPANPINMPTLALGFDNDIGERLLTVYTPLSSCPIPQVAGRCEAECRIPSFPLAPGEYWLKIGMTQNNLGVEFVERAFTITVVDGEAFGEGRGFMKGVCVAPSQWSLQTAESNN